MASLVSPSVISPPLTCLDGGKRHAWHGTGMDIVDGHAVYTARCVWCPVTAARKKNTDPPFRSSVRIKA